LAVAKGFVEAMGGELTLEDTPGGGLTSVISLPAAGLEAGTGPGALPLAGTEKEPAAP
jgi:two-component system sensor histidine kinase KdpD